ncbi:MAG: CDP-alcohol phosphatidyltransferase family protein [Candidatus Saccharimonadaceae bacterium]
MQLLQKLIKSGQLPNTLTWIRMGLFWVPAYLIIAGPNNPALRWWSVVTFVLIVATDKFDGYLARRLNQVTKLGQVIDPLADKLLVLALVIALCLTNILAAPWGWWFLAFNLVRELGVTFLRYQRKHGKSDLVIPADEDGKRKMVLQSVGIGVALMPFTDSLWAIFIWLPLAASLFYSVRSGIHYLRAK